MATQLQSATAAANEVPGKVRAVAIRHMAKPGRTRNMAIRCGWDAADEPPPIPTQRTAETIPARIAPTDKQRDEPQRLRHLAGQSPHAQPSRHQQHGGGQRQTHGPPESLHCRRQMESLRRIRCNCRRHHSSVLNARGEPESHLPTALANSAARSVFSQVNSGSLRPKWPPAAVLR